MAFSVLLAATLLMTDAPAFAQTAEPIRYTLSFPAPHTHYVEVTAAVPTGRQPSVELMMAVWTPGSYLVREYSRNVERVTAAGRDGRALAVEKSDKNRWRVDDRRRADRHRQLSRLRPRDVGAHQLGRGGLRADQRRADVHDAGRSLAAPARGRARAARRLARSR